MKKSLLSIAVMVMSMFAASGVQAQTSTTDEKPLLTIGCLSDLHNELGLINGTVDQVRLRGTILNTLNGMKEQENLDMIILGGDYTSDCTIPEENWFRVKDLIHDATKDAFPMGTTKFPVLYVTGNHDYEVANFDNIPKPYNAARYYDFIMKNDLGELDENECYFEAISNGTLGRMDVLAAYHYMINGFDFVVLNCARHFFKSAWDYQYTDASVEWVANKLDEIYAADPDKTVFFLAHMPFPDSNSISNVNKGISNSTLLKKTLAKHPNVIFLYGHDHGKDTAYTRTHTSQRVTRYNSDGNVISAFDETHVDGLEQGKTEEKPEEPTVDGYTAGNFFIVNKADGKYLGYDGFNAATVETENLSVITQTNATDGIFNFYIGTNASGQHYLHIGSGGRFSIGDASNIFLFKVDAHNTDGTLTATKASSFDVNGEYMLVGVYSSAYYALSNTLYNAGSASNQRMESFQGTLDGLTLTVDGGDNVCWSFVAEKSTEVEPTPVTTFPNTAMWYQLKNGLSTVYEDIRKDSYMGYYPETEWNIIIESNTSAKTLATSEYICGAAPFTDDATQAQKDGQLWRFIPNADGTKYCVVNKAHPDGAISNKNLKNQSGTNTSRWGYVADRTATPDEVEWFTIANQYGTEGGNPISNLAFDNTIVAANNVMQMAAAGQQFQLMRLSSPTDPGAQWEFIAVEEFVEEPVVKPSKEFTTGSFYVINKANSKYLGVDTYQASVLDEEHLCEITTNATYTGAFSFAIGKHPTTTQTHLACSTGGRFSVGDEAPVYIYKVTLNDGEYLTAEKVSSFNTEDDYIFLVRCQKSPNYYYALTGELYSPGSSSQRLEQGGEFTAIDESISMAANSQIIWNFGTEEEEEVVEPVVTEEGLTAGSYCIRNVGDQGYLTFGSYNAETSADPVACNITSTNGVFNITCGQAARYLYCGTNGYFSGNTGTFAITLYEVDSKTDETITGHKVNAFNFGKQYFITGVKNGTTYAVSCELTNAGTDDQRMLSTAVTLDGDNASIPANDNLLWEFSLLPEADPSFFSLFMGSMRYYSNSIEGDVSVTNSRIVQGLMIYVYSDRVVFQMKNYGESGIVNGITIAETPAAYTVFRSIKPDTTVVGINSVEEEKANAAGEVYDLLGRRVNKADKGVYIVNGEKKAF